MADEIAHDMPPLRLKVYKDGRVERLLGSDTVPPSTDPQTEVESKDAVISQDPPISARLYLPKSAAGAAKLPLLIYFHGGGFCIESASSPTYHNYLNSLVSAAHIVAVSVEYQRAPEHPLPVAYEDSRAALKWVAAHFDGNGPEDWINRFADFKRVFFAGDSAGANIAHHMGLKFGSDKLTGVNLIGIVLIHPYFWGTEPVGSELTNASADMGEIVTAMWRFACPGTSGTSDPFFNPAKDPKLGKMGCEKVVVFVAEKDGLRDRGWYYAENSTVRHSDQSVKRTSGPIRLEDRRKCRYYAEVLGKSGWNGVVEVVEAKGEPHVFHLFNPTCENAVEMQKQIVSFLNQ